VFDPDVYPMDRSWLTGKTSADHLRHTRPEYYATLVEPAETAAATAPVDDPTPTGNSSTSSEPGEKPPSTPLPPEPSSAS
jgi:hypothetical protein